MLQALSKLHRRFLVNLRKMESLNTASSSHVSPDIDEEKKVTILYNEDTNDLALSLRYVNTAYKIDRVFNFHRQSSEKCSTILDRINTNILKAIQKKVKNKDQLIKVNVELTSKLENEDVAEIQNTPCLDVLVKASDIYCLKIDDISYSLDVNPPILTSVELPKNNIMAGFLLYPSKLEGLNCNIENVVLRWFRSINKFQTYEEASRKKVLTYEELGTGFNIMTTTDDISRLYKLIGTPYNGSTKGAEFEVVSKVLVSQGPKLCPFEKRHCFTEEVLSNNQLRVVSYNILADLYADSDFSRTNLFPTCPPFALSIEYRKQLFIKEILGYNADLICLQEVDEKIFVRDLQPLFRQFGLEGNFTKKSGLQVAEGLVTFYRKDKLELLEETSFVLSEQLQENPLFSDILEKVIKNESLFDTFMKRTTVLQVNIYRNKSCPSKVLVVGNVHQYFDPLSDHIRLLQAAICLNLLRSILQMYKTKNRFSENDENDPTLIFCGDFNSCPENAVYRFMLSQFIGDDEVDWSSKPGEEVKGVSLSHDLEIESACGTPSYTNYTVGFNGCLDYIFYQSDKLLVSQIVPFPSHEEVTEHGALPSLTFPSDHIALIADLQWKV